MIRHSFPAGRIGFAAVVLVACWAVEAAGQEVTNLQFGDAEIRIIAGSEFQIRGHQEMTRTGAVWQIRSNGQVIEVSAAPDEKLAIRGQRLTLSIESTPAILDIEAETGSVSWIAPSSGSKLFLRHGQVTLKPLIPIEFEVENWSGLVHVELPDPDSQSLELATSGRIWSDVGLMIERDPRSEPSKRARRVLESAPTLKVTSRRAELEIDVPCRGSE